MNGIVGHQIARLDRAHSYHIPEHSSMSQNGPLRLSQARKCSTSLGLSKRKSKTDIHGLKTPQGEGKPHPKSYDPDTIGKVVETVMTTYLQDLEYNTETCIRLSQSLAGTVMEKIRPFSSGNYKLVVVVSIGNNRDKAGLQFGSRCLWNKDSDSFLNVKYSNESLFAVAMVYCLLFE